MIKADVIEPWDNYIPQGRDRRHHPVDPRGVHRRRQALQLAVPARRHRHGLALGPDRRRPACPTPAPATWDEYLANAKAVVDSGAAPFGATFDAHGWRSLAPMTHSMSSDVYTSEGLFDFTSDAAVEALMLMKKIMALSHPDILLAGATDGGVNGTPDEVAFAAQRVGYYTKYFNAPLRMAQYWDDPDASCSWRRCPSSPTARARRCSGPPAAALFKYGKNKEKAAEYIKALTYDPQIWQDSIAGTRDRASRPAAALQVGLRRVGRQQARLDAAVRRPGARPARQGQGDHEPPVRPAAVRDRPAALGDLPQGRGERSEGGAAEGGRRRAGRDRSAASTVPHGDRCGTPAGLGDSPRPPAGRRCASRS